MRITQISWFNLTNNLSVWPNVKSEILSIVLSSLLLKKYNSAYHLELVTNEESYKILKNVYDMPFDSVKVELDCCDPQLSNEIWSFKKMFAYSLNNGRFLNVDTDVFKWTSFPEDLLGEEIIVQNYEIGFDFYKTIHDEFVQHFGFLPWIQNPLESTDAICVGVIGGDPHYFASYFNELTKFFNGKAHKISSFKYKNSLSIYLEQFSFYNFLKQSQKEIKMKALLPDVSDPNYPGFTAFNFLTQFTDFIHPLGKTKRLTWIGEQIENRLRIEFPESYFTIINTIRTKFSGVGWRPSNKEDLNEPKVEIGNPSESLRSFKRSTHLLQKFGLPSKASSREELLNTIELINDTKLRSLVLDCIEYEYSLSRVIPDLFINTKPSWLTYARLIDSFYANISNEYWNDHYKVKLDNKSSVLVISKWRWTVVRDYDWRNERIDSIESNIGKFPSFFFTLFHYDFELEMVVETELTGLEGHVFQIISDDYLTVNEIFSQMKDFFTNQSVGQDSEVVLKAKIIERLRAWGVSGKILLLK